MIGRGGAGVGVKTGELDCGGGGGGAHSDQEPVRNLGRSDCIRRRRINDSH